MTTDTVGQMSTSAGELTRVQDEQDPYTHALLASFDLPAAARCLELGAGAGSIAEWMAARFGPSHVTAVDRDTSRLDDLAGIGVEVLTTDISAFDAAPGTFDLIHARAVLTHLPERERVLASAVTWLKPGGYLLVADPADFPVASSPYPEVRRMSQALTDMAARWGTDTGWARRYPRQLMDAGLEDVDAECRLRMMRGGTREAMMLVDLYRRARPALVGAGVAEDEVEAVLELLQSSSYVDLPPAVIRAWGRKPGANAR